MEACALHPRSAEARARSGESRVSVRRSIERGRYIVVLPRSRAQHARFRDRARRTTSARIAGRPSIDRGMWSCPSRTVSPAELRAIVSLPTRRQAVWRPSTIRWSRSQVVNGRRRIASIGASATSRRHQPEIAGLQHERERADGLFHRPLIEIAAQSRIGRHRAADPQQTIEIDAGVGGRCDVQRVERVDEGDEARRGTSPPRSPATGRSPGQTSATRRALTAARAGTRRPDVRPRS